MAIRWEFSGVVDRPIGEVWAYLTDWFNAPRMSGSGNIGMRQTSPSPMGVGSTLAGRRVILGFETRNIYQCSEWDPPHALAMTMEGRPFRSFAGRVTLESVPDGTRAVILAEFELQPVMKVLYPFVGPLLKRRWRAGFAHTKAMIESKVP